MRKNTNVAFRLLVLTMALPLVVLVGLVTGWSGSDLLAAAEDVQAVLAQRFAEISSAVDLGDALSTVVGVGALGGLVAILLKTAADADSLHRRSGAGLHETWIEAAPPVRFAEQYARHQELSVLYGKYLTDPLMVLRRPLLNDVTNERTAEFVEAYAELGAIAVSEDSSTADVTRYRDAVTRAWKAWRVADAEATRVGTGEFDAKDQKRIQRAIDLLTLATDRSASEFERTSALTQAHKLIEGLVVLPEEAVLELEASVRPVLEA